MIEQDTLKLLRECDSGVKMGTASITDCLPNVKDSAFYEVLNRARSEHERLGKEIESMLNEYGSEGKNPNPIVKGMSWFKTNMELTLNPNDKTVAGLISDGCNMGIKSLSGYLNKYEAAEERAKDIAKKLIAIEDSLARDCRGYL